MSSWATEWLKSFSCAPSPSSKNAAARQGNEYNSEVKALRHDVQDLTRQLEQFVLLLNKNLEPKRPLVARGQAPAAHIDDEER